MYVDSASQPSVHLTCQNRHTHKHQAEETVVEIEARFQHPALQLIRVRGVHACMHA